MTSTMLHDYIGRRQERLIEDEVAHVAVRDASRVVLLYGAGGVGKTQLVRAMAAGRSGGGRSAGGGRTVWVEPIDVDDSEYWLLSNLERQVATTLDPQRRFFGPYLEYLSRLPRYTHTEIGNETVVSHLGRIKQVFVDCYRSFVAETGTTVVITLDTIEAIRRTVATSCPGTRSPLWMMPGLLSSGRGCPGR